jgi:hypothetical protein
MGQITVWNIELLLTCLNVFIYRCGVLGYASKFLRKVLPPPSWLKSTCPEDGSSTFFQNTGDPPGTHWIGGWVGPGTGLDDVKRKFLPLPGLEV